MYVVSIEHKRGDLIGRYLAKDTMASDAALWLQEQYGDYGYVGKSLLSRKPKIRWGEWTYDVRFDTVEFFFRKRAHAIIFKLTWL